MLNEQGATIIYTSHYMEEVEQICSRIAILDRGKVLAQGTADELKAIGFVFTNDDAGAATSIESAVRSVKEIEELTGFKFFRNLDPAVADAVKSQKNLADW